MRDHGGVACLPGTDWLTRVCGEGFKRRLATECAAGLAHVLCVECCRHTHITHTHKRTNPHTHTHTHTHRHTGQGTMADEQPAETTSRKAKALYTQHACEHARAPKGACTRYRFAPPVSELKMTFMESVTSGIARACSFFVERAADVSACWLEANQQKSCSCFFERSAGIKDQDTMRDASTRRRAHSSTTTRHLHASPPR
jgi:hypothetical protein